MNENQRSLRMFLEIPFSANTLAISSIICVARENHSLNLESTRVLVSIVLFLSTSIPFGSLSIIEVDVKNGVCSMNEAIVEWLNRFEVVEALKLVKGVQNI